MRSGIGLFVCSVIAIAGCGTPEPRFEGAGEPEHAGHGGAAHHAEAQAGEPAEAQAGPRPTRVLEDGSRLFGAELAGERATTALSTIVQTPAEFDGQAVRTEGTIERVCQRMGCWMELRAENVPAVRVPMAGHAFFLPRDVAGRTAMIEGRVAVQELSPEAREHLASEGALATASSLSIDATSVVVR